MIQKENGGVRSARNTTIDNASSHNIWFVDGDYVIVENSVQKILDYLNNSQILPEIVICDYLYFNKDSIRQKIIEDVRIDKKEYIDGTQCAFLWGNSVFGTVWHCLFQFQFLLNSHKRFDEDLYCNEDEDWLVCILLQAHSVSIFNEFIYKYRIDRVGSITNDLDLLKRFKSKYKV